MTVRELVNELTESYVDWDAEVHIAITEEPVKNGKDIIWKDYKVDKCDLYTPTWYVGDECHLLLKQPDVI